MFLNRFSDSLKKQANNQWIFSPEHKFNRSPKRSVQLWWLSFNLLASYGAGQAQSGVNVDFGVQLHLWSRVQSPHETRGILTELSCTFGANLVIPAWTGDEISHGHARDWRTHGHKLSQRQWPQAITGLGWKNSRITVITFGCVTDA